MNRVSYLTRIGTVLLILILALQSPVFVVASQTAQEPNLQRELEEFYRRHERGWTVRLSDDRRRVTSLFGRRTKPYQGKPSEKAAQFLRENSRLFGLSPELPDLRLLAEKSSRVSANVEFQQMFRGLPVENGRIQINFDNEGHVLQVVSSYAPVAGASEQVTITKQQASETALNEFLRTTSLTLSKRDQQQASQVARVSRSELQLRQPPKIDDVFFIRQERLRRAYKTLIEAIRPFGIKEIVTDASSGEVLQTRNFVFNAVDGQGQVFIPNPVNSQNNNTISDSSDANSAVSSNNPNPYFTVGLAALNVPAAGPFSLQGPFAKLEDIEAPNNTPPSETNATGFSYLRNPDTFEDVMVYYHIDRMQRYIQSLGFIDAMNRQIRADAHGVNGADNSFYVSTPATVGQGYLTFGDGGIDDAEDADVIAHEYGHALHDNQAPAKYGTGDQANAMGEGFGDYWAVSSYANETLASGHEMACVMEWDAVPNCLRRVDANVTADDFNAAASVYANALIWSRTLFDIFNLLGKTTADRLILQSHFNVPDGPTFLQAADAIVTADLQLFSGSHLTQLCTVFTNRKIYQAANCPTVPAPTGNQNTLVVLAKFNDAGLPAAPLTGAQVTTLVTGINNYLNEVTYAQASLTQQTKGWLALPASRAQYYDQTTGNMLVDLTQDVIDKILADDPSFNFTNIDRMVILTNDDGTGGETRGQKEWATTGPWPFTLPAAFGSKRLSVSVHRFDQIEAQLTHGMGHHFGLGDLYPHEGVTFPRPFADGWGNMAKTPAGTFNNTHFFGWDKLRPNWLANANLRFIPRPGDGAVFDETIPLFRQEVAAGSSNRMLIQVGTTRGLNVNDRLRERASYYIEARQKTGTYDANIPATGVVVYYLNEDISQGFGPLRIVDATPGDNDLTNAALTTGGVLANIDGTGLAVEVLAPTGSEDFRVRIVYDPPETAVDVSINPRDPNWNSPDIWIDSPACNGGNCGFDTDNGRSETDRGDKPKVGQVNRAYARIRNNGPGTANNVRVDFWFSDPYHGIDGGGTDADTGGNVAFNKHFFTEIPNIGPGRTVTVFVNWTPASIPPGQPNPHSCIKVKIAKVFNDTNDFNQVSQENIEEYDTTSGSPYKPVVNPIRVANPYDHPILVYLRADNVPVGWQTQIVPKKVFLPVGGSVDAEVTIQPPENYPVCSTEYITVSAWYPSGDTLVELGGATARVNLKASTVLTFDTQVERCKRSGKLAFSFAPQAASTCNSKLTTKGCTNPKRPFEHVTIEYKGPDGKPIYHDVITDANGCFEDFLVDPQGGIWTTQAEYPGNDCAGTTHTPERPVVVFPGGFPQSGEGRGPWFSFHLGMNFPLGSFNKTHDPGPSLTFDLEYPVARNFSVVGLLGFHYFHGEDVPDLYYTNLSLNGKLYFPVGSWRGFVNAGPGVYFPKTGPSEFGFNVGTGLQFQLQPKLVFEVGPDFHFVDPGGRRRVFLDAKMGIAFRF